MRLAQNDATAQQPPQALDNPPIVVPAHVRRHRHIADSDDVLPDNVKIFEGSGVFTGVKPAPHQAGAAPGDVTLDFVDVDIHDVVRSVFGQMLKLPYSIDPQVTGHITLRTGTPIAQDAVLPALETALKSAGVAVVQSNGMYSVVPIAAAQKNVGQIAFGADQGGPAGYGIEIVPLRFISAEAMQKLLGPLVPQSGILSVDPERNLIFLSGTEPERNSIKQTIALFDVDYLQGMSYALVQPTHVDVGTLATELSKIFDETGSPIAGLIRMIPIARINTLMIVSSRASYLREVSHWIERLDVVPVTPGRQLHYYRLSSARAADVAQTLGQFFGGASVTTSTEVVPPPAIPMTGTPSMTPTSMNSAAPPMSPDGFSAPVPAPAPAAAYAQPAFHSEGSRTEGGDGPQIVTDVANNALIIRADAADYAQIEDMIRHMDVTPDQVLVDVTIAEVTLTDQLKYGVEWFFQNGGATFAEGPTGTPATHFPGFGFTYNIPNVKVTLSALGSLTKINVVSSPKLLMLDNKSATLQVGDEVPVVTQTSVSSVGQNAPLVSTVEQRDTGVILTVTPRIGANGMVFLDVSQEVSDVVPTTTSTIDSPTIQQRRVKSTVAVSDGATIAMGGLMQRSETSGNGGVPYLKDVPVLGALFSNANNERDRTELLIFLTPRVIRSPQDASAVTDDLSKGLEDVKKAQAHFEKNKNDIPRLPWR